MTRDIPTGISSGVLCLSASPPPPPGASIARRGLRGSVRGRDRAGWVRGVGEDLAALSPLEITFSVTRRVGGGDFSGAVG